MLGLPPEAGYTAMEFHPAFQLRICSNAPSSATANDCWRRRVLSPARSFWMPRKNPAATTAPTRISRKIVAGSAMPRRLGSTPFMNISLARILIGLLPHGAAQVVAQGHPGGHAVRRSGGGARIMEHRLRRLADHPDHALRNPGRGRRHGAGAVVVGERQPAASAQRPDDRLDAARVAHGEVP